MHDLIEDTGTTKNVLEEQFDADIANWVDGVSNQFEYPPGVTEKKD
jgi:(p)ppGpp synthase/HD superfamily hydrolase